MTALRDITERKRAEAALYQSEAEFKDLFNNAPVGFHELDAEGRLIRINQTELTLLGYSAEELLGQFVWKISAEEEEVRRSTLAKLSGAPLLSEGFERTYRRKDGSPVAMWINDRIVKGEDGGIKGIRSTIQDITARKRAEAELAASEKRHRAIFDGSPVPLAVNDGQQRITYLNRAFVAAFGYTREDIPTLADWWPKAYPDPQYRKIMMDSWNARVEQAQRTGQPFEPLEAEVRCKDGTIKTILADAAPLAEGDYAEEHLAVLYDITERKLAEQRVQQLNRTYSLLSDINKLIVREKVPAALLAAACRIAVETGKFRMAWVGLFDAATRHLDSVASAGCVEGYTDRVNIDLRDPSRLSGPAATCLRSGEHRICNDIERDPDYLPWRDEALRRGYRSSGGFPLKVDGKTIGVFNLYADTPQFFNPEELRLLDELAADISFALEVSQREDERRRMEESHARLALAVEQAAETIVITDTEGTILYANPAFEKTTGYTRAEALGQNPRILKSCKQDAEFYRRMWAVLARGEVWEGHFFNKRKDGTLYEEEATISPVRDAAGKVVNFVAVKRDVTREAQLEAQLRQTQKMEAIGTLAGGVAHDFNNILAIISMQASLLKGTGVLSPEQISFADEISATVKRAADLTRQLLLFSRKEELQPRDLDLNQAVTDLTKMLRRVLMENIGLELKLAGQPLFVHADQGMLDQVLMNLAANARDAMPNGGRLVIETSAVEFDGFAAAQSASARPGAFACLSVSDGGGGIPPELLPRIFEPFFTTKEAGKGTGLGLATVFGIVQQHKGWINAYSEVGKGTVFKIYLPRLAGMTAQKNAEKMLATVPSGHETILLAEDEPVLREAIRKTLAQLGYRVLEAATGHKALEVWKEHRKEINLLLTDMVMPDGLTGKELAQRLLRENPKLKVIYMSGYTTELVGRDFPLKEGVNFLAKPFETSLLAQIIRDSLDRTPSK